MSSPSPTTDDSHAPNVQHSRSISQPLPSDQKTSAVVRSNRARAPSDPFLDTPLSRSAGTSSPSDDPPTSVSACIDNGQPLAEDPDEQVLRIWTSPDLTDPEYLDLLKAFPSFITRQTLPRFPTATKETDLEEAGFQPGSNQIRFGTGSMWISSKPRRPGWKGGWWTRFIMWLRRTFC